MISLQIRNELSRVPVTGTVPAIVSLTSYGKRVAQVHLTIESIARGAVKPSRLILWLDDPEIYANLPKSLRRLQRRGLEVLLSENFGPHTKYLPYVLSDTTHELPLVTADDDTMYPVWWLERLYASWSRDPQNVYCYRARVVTFTPEGDLATYLDWPEVSSTVPRLRHFALGVSGAIYPPHMLAELRRRGATYDPALRHVDDIWLHSIAVSLQIRVAQAEPSPHDFPLLLSSQDVGLRHRNLDGGNNDKAAVVAYPPELLDRLRYEG
ncbi:hypothetical protein [Microbacterium sp. 1P10AE]|uniref:hypothetical protein n=1 Tax=Microbacterium sp. 1P10AE TaxID=3132286 RepID=UPI00399F1BD6